MDQFERFSGAWQQLTGVHGSRTVFKDLLAAYAEPQRVYHSTAHLWDCLEQFDAARHLADHGAAVELALWFHDAVYDPTAADNEQQSAALAGRQLADSGAKSVIIEEVGNLILATRHHTSPHGRDMELLLDVDLSILGRAPSLFDSYDRAIRAEYQFVPDKQYREARTCILSGFLNREFIYHTDDFRRQYEQQARANLHWAIAQLRK
jgi:predicted metal-dependent HD superfamily phosphohydrolase